jgi:peptide chain release factor 1
VSLTPQIIDKLEAVVARSDELARLLSDPAVQADGSAYRTHAKARAELEDLVEAYGAWSQVDRELGDARELIASGDTEMAALANEELPALEAKRATLADRIRLLLIPRDPNDDRNVMVEIRAGTGGDEAALFAGDLFRPLERLRGRAALGDGYRSQPRRPLSLRGLLGNGRDASI